MTKPKKLEANPKSNKLLLALCVLVIASLSYSFYLSLQFKKSKIACIDIPKVVSKSSEIQQLNKEFELKEKQLKFKSDTLLSELESEIKVFEKEISLKKNSDKEAFSKSINARHSQLLSYKEINKNKLEEQKQKAMAKVLSKIDQIAKQISLKGGYKVVFGAVGNGNIIYMNESVDVTNEVISLLNNE